MRTIGKDLLSVTLGNIVGGAGLVGLAHWFIYFRPGTPSMHAVRSMLHHRPFA